MVPVSFFSRFDFMFPCRRFFFTFEFFFLPYLFLFYSHVLFPLFIYSCLFSTFCFFCHVWSQNVVSRVSFFCFDFSLIFKYLSVLIFHVLHCEGPDPLGIRWAN
jgi:hypothetical protein